jgi:hypothetical protein
MIVLPRSLLTAPARKGLADGALGSATNYGDFCGVTAPA